MDIETLNTGLTDSQVLEAFSKALAAISASDLATALLGYFPLGLGTEIPSGVTALSQLTQAGVYYRLSGFHTAFSDLPANWGNCAAGNVIVLPTAVAWRSRQILLPAALVSSAPVPYWWHRYMTGGTASDPSGAQYRAWIEFAGTVLTPST